MSLLKANSVQIGQSATATQNFTLSVPSSPDGTIKLARGNSGATTADILSVNASGAITGATINGGAVTSGTAVASTSGTAIDFTSIPSWVKKITVMLNGVSTSGTSNPWLIQVGDSGGIEATGYLATSTRLLTSTLNTGTATSGFNINVNNASTNVCHGSMTITLLDLSTNSWVASGVFTNSALSESIPCAGSKSLSATLDRVRITTSGGTDTFDAGTVNILYEG
jgi:hypothetical protein